MPSKLLQNSYGKSSVRLTKIVRHAHRHELLEFRVDTSLTGDFADSYEKGDNRKIIATDSMKNTVYVLAKENRFETIEQFAALLGGHFVSTYPQVLAATVSISQTKWERLNVENQPHPHAFVGGNRERRTCRAEVDRGSSTPRLFGGITGLELLKTTDSEFAGFVTDRYRTLKDARDRVFATTVEAIWDYSGQSIEFNDCFAMIRSAIITTFANHYSLAVQQTLLAMGDAALAACPAVSRIELKLPNVHRVPVSLESLGIPNNNEVFMPVDEPFGLITGVVSRA